MLLVVLMEDTIAQLCRDCDKYEGRLRSKRLRTPSPMHPTKQTTFSDIQSDYVGTVNGYYKSLCKGCYKGEWNGHDQGYSNEYYNNKGCHTESISRVTLGQTTLSQTHKVHIRLRGDASHQRRPLTDQGLPQLSYSPARKPQINLSKG